MLEDLINGYQTPAEATELAERTKIALLSGISGAGKDTIKQGLLESGGFKDVVSHTTRAPRSNNAKMEQDGVDYHFINLDQAESMLKNHDFIEAKFVHGTVYGTSIEELRQAQKAGVIAITDIDVQGVAEYKKIAPSSISLFIVPPDYDEWIRRLKARYQTEAEFQQEWGKRRDSSIRELTNALEVPYFHCIINDDIDRAVRVCREIIMRPDTFIRKDDEARLVARDLLQTILDKS